jgi:hypothetical protein
MICEDEVTKISLSWPLVSNTSSNMFCLVCTLLSFFLVIDFIKGKEKALQKAMVAPSGQVDQVG